MCPDVGRVTISSYISDEYRDEFVDILRNTGAVQVSAEKKFLLASGKFSDHYFDLKTLCGDPTGIIYTAHLIYALIKQINAESGYSAAPIKSVGGIESGSISIATAVSVISKQDKDPDSTPLTSFFVRKNRKGHGSRKMIEGIPRSPAVIVDDVVTSGGSALSALGFVRDEYECNHLLCVIFRGTDRQEESINETVRLDYVFNAPYILGRLRQSGGSQAQNE